jgi:TM2 domain-containing membrane protein YozV
MFDRVINNDKLMIGGENMASPIIALIISFFLPGIGTVYAGNIMKGIIIFVVAVILGALATVFLLGIIAYILYIIVWLYGMYDAYTTAATTV